MKKSGFLLVALWVFSGCVEQFTFKTGPEPEGLVVEAFISDLSYLETALMPIDARYFTVKLKRPSVVTNKYDELVKGAQVLLVSDDGQSWPYTETTNAYLLMNNSFQAVAGVGYKIDITLADGKRFESDFKYLVEAPPMGEISYEEVEKEVFATVSGQKEMVTIRGVDIYVTLPETSQRVNYRWDSKSAWIYVASRTAANSPLRTCWVQDDYYIENYVLNADLKGGYKQKVAFLQTSDNERVMYEFTMFVRQTVFDDETFLFWDDVLEQTKRGGIFDPPPYNVRTNIRAINNEVPVFGYFTVAREEGKRWYVKNGDLSYRTDFVIACPMRPPPDANPCGNCTHYPGGGVSRNIKPNWWR